MIHYVVVGVAMSRPPKTDEYRRYAIYGGTHHDAELVATQMAACTSVMPVETVRNDGDNWGDLCGRAGCVRAQQEPHGVMGCTCWHIPWDDDLDSDGTEAWQVSTSCRHHATDDEYFGWATSAAGVEEVNRECPPGVHSMFDPRPGGCGDTTDFDAVPSAGDVFQARKKAACRRECGANPMDCPGMINGKCMAPKTEEGAPQWHSASPPRKLWREFKILLGVFRMPL